MSKNATHFGEFCKFSSQEDRGMCRSRQALSNEGLVAKIGFDPFGGGLPTSLSLKDVRNHHHHHHWIDKHRERIAQSLRSENGERWVSAWPIEVVRACLLPDDNSRGAKFVCGGPSRSSCQECFSLSWRWIRIRHPKWRIDERRREFWWNFDRLFDQILSEMCRFPGATLGRVMLKNIRLENKIKQTYIWRKHVEKRDTFWRVLQI